ncbi:MAG: hypothetical protein WDO74_02005 [Pseudomonadota bacterium]
MTRSFCTAAGLIGACLVLAAAFSSPCQAEPVPSEETADEARARVLIREGIDAFKAGKNERAAEALSGAWAIRQTYDVAGSLAQAELALKRDRDAAEHLDYCVNHYSPMDSEEKLRLVKAALAQVKTRVATLVLSADLEGVEIAIDDRSVGRSPLPNAVYLDPGLHQLEARHGNDRVKQALSVQAGREYAVTLRLSVAKSPAPESTTPNYTPAIVASGVGAAALVAGVVFLLEANHKGTERDERLAALPGTNPCGPQNPNAAACSEISSLADARKTFQALSIVGFGMTAAAGAATFFLWPRRPDHAQVGVRALVLPTSMGLSGFAGFDATF